MMRVFGTVMKSSVDGNETQTVKEAKHFMNIENIPRKYPGLYDVIEKTGGTFWNWKYLLNWWLDD